jgi:hypothetical protein
LSYLLTTTLVSIVLILSALLADDDYIGIRKDGADSVKIPFSPYEANFLHILVRLFCYIDYLIKSKFAYLDYLDNFRFFLCHYKSNYFLKKCTYI